jgi:hypothetical protein
MEKKMVEISTGIYRFGRELKSQEEKPLVLIHPWYNGVFGKFKKVHRKTEDEYLSNLRILLKNSNDRLVFLFDEILIGIENGGIVIGDNFENQLMRNAERISRFRNGSFDGLYGILTNPSSSVPFYGGSDAAMELIKYFSSDVDMAGGQLLRGDRGCLGNARRRFEWYGFEVKVIEDCCFR